MLFIVTASWTDQGIRSVKDAPKRMQAAREAAKKMGDRVQARLSHLGRIRPLDHRRGGKRRQCRQICHGKRRAGQCADPHSPGAGPKPK